MMRGDDGRPSGLAATDSTRRMETQMMKYLAIYLFVLVTFPVCAMMSVCDSRGHVVKGEGKEVIGADCDLKLILEIDGVKVYRFMDRSMSGYRYLTVSKDGQASISASHQ